MFLGYARVSTKGQTDGTSLDEQQRKVKAIADLRGASTYDFVLYSEDVSGSVPLTERPEGGKLLANAVKGDTVICSKLDRMFRNTIDALTTVERFKQQGIDLILADISSEPVTGNGVGKLFFGILAQVAEFERERINERTQDGRRAKRAKQGHLGGPPPYGYRVNGEGREAVLVPYLPEQDALMKIKDVMKTHTPAAAQRAIEQMGLRDRAGSTFRIVQLQRMAQRSINHEA